LGGRVDNTLRTPFFGRRLSGFRRPTTSWTDGGVPQVFQVSSFALSAWGASRLSTPSIRVLCEVPSVPVCRGATPPAPVAHRDMSPAQTLSRVLTTPLPSLKFNWLHSFPPAPPTTLRAVISEFLKFVGFSSPGGDRSRFLDVFRVFG